MIVLGVKEKTVLLRTKKTVLLRTTNSQKEINKIATEILRKNLLKRYVTHKNVFICFFISRNRTFFT